MEAIMAEDITSMAVLLAILALVAGLAIALARWMLASRRNKERESETIRHSGGALRRAIIRIGEAAAILAVVLATIIGALASSAYGHVIWPILQSLGLPVGNDPGSSAAWAAFGGGIISFLATSMITARLFALAAIEQNTRMTASLLEHIARSNQSG
jgi:hypothetical protein